jgi:hypothetical protein
MGVSCFFQSPALTQPPTHQSLFFSSTTMRQSLGVPSYLTSATALYLSWL